MFRSLRYQNPTVRDHLASQYVMGLLTPSVKRRVESLMIYDPSFEELVIVWQQRLASLNDLYEPVKPPSGARNAVLSAIQTEPNKTKQRSFWQSLWLWQAIAVSSFALFALTILLSFSSPTQSIQRLAYVAVMDTTVASAEAPLIISAYAKTDKAPSRLELRWNNRLPAMEFTGATLWAIERDTGNVMAIATLQPDSRRLDLTAEQWAAVQNSFELLITAGSNPDESILLKGLCLQLAEWA